MKPQYCFTMATSNGARALSARSLKGGEGGLELLSPEGSSVYMTEVKVDDDLYDNQSNSNPITSPETHTIIGVPRKTQVPPQPISSQIAVQQVNEQLSELHISKALVIETGSDEEESSSESEGETFEDVLRNAGVEFELSSLKPAPDGKAPFELVSQLLACVMNEEFAAAKILCEKVLELEPNNELTTEFYPVILERMKLDAELPTETSSSDSDNDDGEINFVSSGEDSSSSESDTGGGENIPSGAHEDHSCRHKNCTHGN